MLEVERQWLIILRVINLMFLFTTHLICLLVCMKATFIEGFEGILLFLWLKINEK